MAQFATVLVARDKLDPPSELQLSLRHCCQRLRVVSTLTGGAHFIVKEEGTTVALQLYDAKTISSIEQQWRDAGQNDPEQWTRSIIPKKYMKEPSSFPPANQDGDDKVVVGLQNFRDTFMHTIVFFLLPPGEFQRKQLAQANSFFNVAQRSLSSPRRCSEEQQRASKPMASSRIFIVSNTASLQSHLKAAVDSIRPERRATKEKFFVNQRKNNFLPDLSSSTEQGKGGASGGGGASESDVATHIADAFRSWSDGAGIPRGEVDVVMSYLGSLEAIAKADLDALDKCPINDRTKQAIMAFFSLVPNGKSTQMDSVVVTDGSIGNSGYGYQRNDSSISFDGVPAAHCATSKSLVSDVYAQMAATKTFEFTPMQRRPSNDIPSNQNASSVVVPVRRPSSRDPRIRSHHTPFAAHALNGMQAFTNKKPSKIRNYY